MNGAILGFTTRVVALYAEAQIGSKELLRAVIAIKHATGTGSVSPLNQWLERYDKNDE